MVSKDTVLKALPPYRNDWKIVTYEQGTGDIISEILSTHKATEGDYDIIAPMFETGYIYNDCHNIWNFLKYRLNYTIESENEQTVKTPVAILQPGAKTDCKHYSLFAGGVLDAISAANGNCINWCYRFAGYSSNAIEHVFVVVDPGTEDEIWIDPVLQYFDCREWPRYYEDHSVRKMKKTAKVAGVQLSVSNWLMAATVVALIWFGSKK